MTDFERQLEAIQAEAEDRLEGSLTGGDRFSPDRVAAALATFKAEADAERGSIVASHEAGAHVGDARTQAWATTFWRREVEELASGILTRTQTLADDASRVTGRLNQFLNRQRLELDQRTVRTIRVSARERAEIGRAHV